MTLRFTHDKNDNSIIDRLWDSAAHKHCLLFFPTINSVGEFQLKVMVAAPSPDHTLFCATCSVRTCNTHNDYGLVIVVKIRPFFWPTRQFFRRWQHTLQLCPITKLPVRTLSKGPYFAGNSHHQPQYLNASKPLSLPTVCLHKNLDKTVGANKKFMEYFYWGRQHCHLLSPVIRLGLRNPRKKERRSIATTFSKDFRVLQQQKNKKNKKHCEQFYPPDRGCAWACPQLSGWVNLLQWSGTVSWVLCGSSMYTIPLVQWLSWVFATQERKKRVRAAAVAKACNAGLETRCGMPRAKQGGECPSL